MEAALDGGDRQGEHALASPEVTVRLTWRPGNTFWSAGIAQRAWMPVVEDAPPAEDLSPVGGGLRLRGEARPHRIRP